MTTRDKIGTVTERWYRHAPYFATFLLRFQYIDNEDFPGMDIPTMAVTVKNGRPTIIYNDEYCQGLTEEEMEGILYHEILHLTALNQERKGKRQNNIWNIATDAVNNEDIVRTQINGRYLTLPEGGVRMDQIEKKGYEDIWIPEYIYNFLYKNADKIQVSSKGGGSGKSEDGEDDSEGSGSSPQNGEEGEEESKGSGNGKDEGEDELKPLDDHRLLDEIAQDDEAMEAIERVIEEARSKSWGSHRGGSYIQIDSFQRNRPKVDPRKLIHRHVSNFMFSNRGALHYTWTRRNRRGFPIPGKRRAETEVVVFLDVSGSCFSQEVLSKFFGEIDYLSSRGIQIRLVTFDVTIQEDLPYTQGMWKKRKFIGGGGTYAQPIFEHLRQEGKTRHPIMIFTDGIFEWSMLNNYGASPVWVFSENPARSPYMPMSSPNPYNMPFGTAVILEEKESVA